VVAHELEDRPPAGLGDGLQDFEGAAALLADDLEVEVPISTAA
jgi:hypothetical protein